MDRAFHIREILWKAIYDFSFRGSWIAMGWIGTTRKSTWFQKKAGVYFQKKKKKINELPDKASMKGFYLRPWGTSWCQSILYWKQETLGRFFINKPKKKKKKKKTNGNVLPRQQGLEESISPRKRKYNTKRKAKFIIICSFMSLTFFRSRGWKVKEAATQRPKSWVEFNREFRGLRRLRK